jgi:hydrogenase maturation protein HypF
LRTFQIHINGIVQGVGFRPMVYQLATEMQLKGYVQNGNDGVNIVFNAFEDEASLFFKKLKIAAPPHAKIISSQIKEIANHIFADFSIVVDKAHAGAKQVLISPDAAICPDCRAELHDSNNRRYRYPFITCTRCGPRYSIIDSLPYERHTTSMQSFTMCKSCTDEYHNVANRRFFSQTNSCADCGIELQLFENTPSILSNNAERVLSHIKEFLRQGKILAVKGIGGYLLFCSADNPEAIQLLRSRKKRPTKPFAVLYPNIETVQNTFELNHQEKEFLESVESPIVLLYPKPGAFNNLAVNDIAPGLKRLGIMVPYSPLLELIANDFGRPLIATSANISGSPIIFRDDDALNYLFGIADYVVSYNREIVVPQDDSVIQVSRHSNQTIILRRSRGYAPSFLHYTPQTPGCVLSTGAFLKSSFTLSVKGNVFVSQFLGSGESYESWQMYKYTLSHLMGLYSTKPDTVIADMHPGYFSHQYAREFAEEYGIKLQLIQHHKAHFSAVLAENDLIRSKKTVLGVVWDGTGLGDDGNVWGGEFFIYENNEINRCCHFDYFPVIAGDKMAREPRISALCAANSTWPPCDILRDKFTNAEWNNYQSLIHTTTLFTSSVGRIFDAVASLLDLGDKQTYEGEAAMYLQALAEDYINENGFVMDNSYFKEGKSDDHISTTSLMQGILLDIQMGKAKTYIAAKFHYSLVGLIDLIAKRIDVENICFSGGVFQNATLVDWIQYEYGDKYKLHFHKHLSPNDENISFGQLVYYENMVGKKQSCGAEQDQFEKVYDKNNELCA